MTNLKIGDLARATGTTNETLRFYESRGLLETPSRTAAGYRIYGQDDLARVQFIIRARRMGFSLAEIAELLSLKVDKQASTCGEVKELAEAKLDAIEEKIRELNRVKHALEKMTAACCGGEESAVHCTILQALESPGGPDDTSATVSH